MSIESVLLSNHLILCHFLLLLPSVFPSNRFFPNEWVLQFRWPKYWSFSFSVSPSSKYSELISLGLTGLIFLQSQGLSRVFSSITIVKYQLFHAHLLQYANYTSMNVLLKKTKKKNLDACCQWLLNCRAYLWKLYYFQIPLSLSQCISYFMQTGFYRVTFSLPPERPSHITELTKIVILECHFNCHKLQQFLSFTDSSCMTQHHSCKTI